MGSIIKGTRTTVQAHLPANIQAVNEFSFDKMMNWAASIGKYTEEVITSIIDTRRILTRQESHAWVFYK
jgi:hypothetical protein